MSITTQHVYIIVEGPSDQLILSIIFDGVFDEHVKIHYYVAHGVSGIVSSTRPIMDLVDTDVKIVVVYDADTSDELRAEERNDFIKSQILNGQNDERLLFVYFVPRIDQSHVFLSECARNKRKARDEYNAKVSEFIKHHKNDFLKIEQIKQIVEFVNK